MLFNKKAQVQIKRQDDGLIKQLETNSEQDATRVADTKDPSKWEGIRDEFYRSGRTRSHAIWNRRTA